jgi:hypothetical protein
MRICYKLAAVCAVFLIALCFFSTVAYATPEDETTSPAAETTTVPATSPAAESAAPADTAVRPILPPGTGTVVDVFAGEDGRKFYTIQTPAGNTFYLIIDFTKQSENVYFLDAVQEKDLLALAEKAAGNADPGTNSNPASGPSGNQAEPKPESGDSMSGMILIAAIVVVGGGAGIYFKVIRKRRNADSRDEYEDGEDDYAPDEPEPDGEDTGAEPEDGSPTWEDEDV